MDIGLAPWPSRDPKNPCGEPFPYEEHMRIHIIRCEQAGSYDKCVTLHQMRRVGVKFRGYRMFDIRKPWRPLHPRRDVTVTWHWESYEVPPDDRLMPHGGWLEILPRIYGDGRVCWISVRLVLKPEIKAR